jgi:D-xylose transport system ATP-binding protein
MNSRPLLDARNITKAFPGVAALQGVNLAADAGEIVAIVGENGAGKSTLMKILAGVYPTGSFEGEVRLDGQPLHLRHVPDAEARGIVMIPQELSPVKEMSVAENVFLNREPTRFGVIQTDLMRRETAGLLREFELDVDPAAAMKTIRIAKQQLIEIAKALSKRARVIVLDEPTSALSPVESGHLFTRLRELKRAGMTCLYVSHRIAEVLEVADRVVVLRDGLVVGQDAVDNLNETTLISMMLGRAAGELYPREAHTRGVVVLELRDVSVPPVEPGLRNVVQDVNLRLHAGEILGLFGLMGAGRTELVMALFGAWPVPPAGEIRVRGKRVPVESPIDAIRAGLALLTEDRQRYGLVATLDVRRNISLGSLKHLTRLGVIDEQAEADLAETYVNDLGIRPPQLDRPVLNLSGGNQQKVLLARGLATKPTVLVLDEPTRGIDVGAKAEVFRLLNKLAQDGLAILFVSSELTEIRALSDRILVMCDGRIGGEFDRDATEEELLSCAIGSSAKR